MFYIYRIEHKGSEFHVQQCSSIIPKEFTGVFQTQGTHDTLEDAETHLWLIKRKRKLISIYGEPARKLYA